MTAVSSLTPLVPPRRAAPKVASSSATAPTPRSAADSPLRIVIVGHVDHGKSTLIGRLFHDTGSLPEGKLEAIQASCETRGVPFEWAFLMDAFKAERDQNITIDTAQIWFQTEKRPYVIIDAPGHREFLKNMVTGAASADAAVLVVAADEGVSDQSRRHAYLLSLLGVSRVVVAVNKIDLVDDPEAALEEIERELGAFMRDRGLQPERFIPVSARDGDNVVTKSERTAFDSGPTLVEALDLLSGETRTVDGPLRFPVQDIYRFDHRRIIAGRIESGTLSAGDTLVFSPGGRKAKVKSIESWAAKPISQASAGQSVGVVLDEQLFIERGHVAAKEDERPTVTTSLNARVFWMGQSPLSEGQRIKVKLVTQEAFATVSAIHFTLDSSSLATDKSATQVERDEVAEVQLTLDRPLATDRASSIATLGRFVFVDNFDVVGGGLVLDAEPLAEASEEAPPESEAVTPRERSRRHGHDAQLVEIPDAPLLLLSEIERALFSHGIHVAALPQRSVDHLPSAVSSLLSAGIVVVTDVALREGERPNGLAAIEVQLRENAFALIDRGEEWIAQTPAALAEKLLQLWNKDARRVTTTGSDQ